MWVQDHELDSLFFHNKLLNEFYQISLIYKEIFKWRRQLANTLFSTIFWIEKNTFFIYLLRESCEDSVSEILTSHIDIKIKYFSYCMLEGISWNEVRFLKLPNQGIFCESRRCFPKNYNRNRFRSRFNL